MHGKVQSEPKEANIENKKQKARSQVERARTQTTITIYDEQFIKHDVQQLFIYTGTVNA